MNQDHAAWVAFLQVIAAYLTAFGTIAVAVLAIWGDYFRHRWVPPKLAVELDNPRGDLNRWANGMRVIYYHLKVTNKRKWSVARNCRVLLKQISRRGPDGEFRRLPFYVPRQFMWGPSESTSTVIDLSDEQLLDFGFINEGEGQKFQPTLYSIPNLFEGYVGPNESVRYSLEIVADGFKGKEYRVFEVAWNGKWTDNLDEMAKDLIMKPA